MRPRDGNIALKLKATLIAFDREKRPLHGIHDSAASDALLEQLLESIHRIQYISVLRGRQPSIRRANPKEDYFDPIKAAVVKQSQGNNEEAFWLVFLFVHFGKHARAGWRYVREIYDRLGEGGRWDWISTSTDPTGFCAWLESHVNQLRRDGVRRCFGNHRKYESLEETGKTVESYVHWVNPPRTHQEMFDEAFKKSDNDSKRTFDLLYRSMAAVSRFGRTARFDFLTMIGKLQLAPIEPGLAYLQSSTGPLKGARLLFGINETATKLDKWLVELDAELQVGMQVLEDALCNWQKSPNKFRPFRG